MQRLIEGILMAYPSAQSPFALRFLASVAQGQSLKSSARKAGVHLEVGYRWLGERYVQLRQQGLEPDAALVELGCQSVKASAWEARFQTIRLTGYRHHLAVTVGVEQAFWAAVEGGAGLEDARRIAGVGRSTAYRWRQQRFARLRQSGSSVSAAARTLRVPAPLARQWETSRTGDAARRQRAAEADLRRAVRASALQFEVGQETVSRRPVIVAREQRYWELMRAGVTNADACRVLGVSRRTGGLIRRRHRHQTATATPLPSGRYLSLRERLQIADLLQLRLSIRRIAAELGRSASTVKRELDRHRDERGRYLPHRADERAVAQRRRPRVAKLIVHDRLRRLVQRKLNRYWSPQQISGWLRTLRRSPAMTVCTETIYRALLVPGGAGLHQRYCAKLRTGRTIRRSRWLNRAGQGAAVRNMTMIDQRPAEVDQRRQVGHWEGDLIVGAGSRSAMVTLRERVTHYGIIVNLPTDHTALSVNTAVTAAFAALPAHLTRTLTWDQGVEMARHRELAAATGVSIYFAERSSPWQRGANENFNGLVRQFFPKGTDLSGHSAGHVTAVMHHLNTRPRKALAYATPAAVLRQAIRQPVWQPHFT